MIRFIHGYDLIGQEMIKIFSIAQDLSSSYLNIKNFELKLFVAERLCLKSSNNKNKESSIYPEIYIKKSFSSNNECYLKAFQDYIGREITEISVSFSLIIDRIQFTSYLNKTKRCDSCFYVENNTFGLIECFVKYEYRYFVIYKKLVNVYSPFYTSLCPEIRCRSSICFSTNQYKVEDIRKIKKATLIKFSEKDIYVSDFSMSHLFN
jgi:hypothetical protein